MKLIVFLTLSFLVGCATTGAKLSDVQLKMSKEEVKNQIGKPESISSAFLDEKGNTVEVLDYRLYQYSGAIEGLSPYYNIYSFIFVNNSLVSWVKTQENARLTEAAAMEIIRGSKATPTNSIYINNSH